MSVVKSKFVKFLEFVSVIAALVIAVLTVKSLSLESILRGKEEPVTLSMTEDGLPEDFIGRMYDIPADILRPGPVENQ